jgi:hypothetical protein
MKCEIVKNCLVKDVVYKPGEELDVDDATATHLINSGYVVPVDSKAKTQDRSVGLKSDKPKRRAKAAE